ncbi:hypothetical protein QJS83_15620 [Bdellovibrio sp. 22V]|uniref:hypothetical protein n=1 Tax=Bdellovibrio TaxID=958 RepID=UPI002543A786|nr:hypothetical protein [Bdellovibrio sp. 22V]WII71892.1 hypothetical protein QJS83_15620 [Bdellovibrio sp. 22V]
MHKVLGFLVPLFFVFSAHADDVRTFSKLGPNTALVKIDTEDKEGTQAAMYIDGIENQEFITMMLADPTSSLSILRKQIETENCPDEVPTPEGHIPGCGEVEFTPIVQTAFGRGGWMEAAATYTFFVGFRFEGTGHYFESTHMVSFSERAEAQVDDNMDYLGVVLKTLNLEKIVPLPK